MSNLSSLIVQRADGTETITVYGLGQLKVVDSDHPNFNRIREILTSGKDVEDLEEFECLFDIPRAIQRAFTRLTDRVTVKGETILFNHEPIHGVLADKILQYVDEGEDFGPLVNFMDKVHDNPSKNSQEALYTWLSDRNFVIKPNGNFLGFKGVKNHTAPMTGPHAGVPASGFTGHAYVDDVEYGTVDENHKLVEGQYIPYPIGALIEMPLPECHDDSSIECSRGLHVGTYEFARGYSVGSSVLSVEVNPRDVVSVPSTWGANQKIRVTRLRVVEEVSAPYPSLVVYDDGEHTDLDEGYYQDEDYDEPDEFEAELPVIAPCFAPLNPPQDWFEEYVARAKRRRQSPVGYIEHMTAKEGHPWKHDGSGDPKSHLSWTVINDG